MKQIPEKLFSRKKNQTKTIFKKNNFAHRHRQTVTRTVVGNSEGQKVAKIDKNMLKNT